MSDSVVYLGAPVSGYTATAADDADPYNSKIGGRPAWLRPVLPAPLEEHGRGKLNNCARCPKCRSAANLRLLSQVYAPLAVFDRTLYLFMCSACSSVEESVVCIFRSQLYNASYDAAPRGKDAQTEAAASTTKESLFAVDDDDEGWGEPEASAAPSPAAAVAPVEAPKPHSFETFVTATPAENEQYALALLRPPLPLLLLDTFPEPEGEKEKVSNKSVADQLAEVEALYPGITEVSAEALEVDKLPVGAGGGKGGPIIVEDDDGPTETPDEIAASEYCARIARCPTQCVRWAPKGQPINSSASRRPPHSDKIPPCSTCGASRVFEFQMLSPSIYFFEKYGNQTNLSAKTRKKPEAGTKAAKEQTIAAVEGRPDEPHFSTITVFTCSEHCYDRDHTVSLEYAHLEPEL